MTTKGTRFVLPLIDKQVVETVQIVNIDTSVDTARAVTLGSNVGNNNLQASVQIKNIESFSRSVWSLFRKSTFYSELNRCGQSCFQRIDRYIVQNHAFDNGEYQNIFKNLIKNAKEDGKKLKFRSVKGGTFLYGKWHLALPVLNLQPKIEYFTFLRSTEINFLTYTKFFHQFRHEKFGKFLFQYGTNKLSNLKIFGGYERIPILQKPETVTFLILLASQCWDKADETIKICIWSLILGFHDTITEDFRQKIEISKTIDYLLEQESRKNVIQISSGQFPFTNFISPKYFSIRETKVNAKTGQEYVNYRYVSDCTISNDFLIEPASNLACNFNTAETIFTDFDLFSWAMKADKASISDKSDFYRSIPIIPNKFSVITTEKNGSTQFWLDLKAKMGHRFSSCYSQLSANLFDYIWNKENGKTSIAVSLQDDTIIMQKGSDFEFAKIQKLNSDLNFKTNELKTNMNQESVVSGQAIILTLKSKTYLCLGKNWTNYLA